MSSNLNATSQENSTKVLTLTFYGYPDNDPPGNEIAYPHVHEIAGGIGTYDDPVTVAIVTDINGGNWAAGTRMYVPSLKKYLLVEDECASCVPDQIDVWMDSTIDYPNEALQCEKTWTPGAPVDVEIDPLSGREVIMAPFFDPNTGVCRQPSSLSEPIG